MCKAASSSSCTWGSADGQTWQATTLDWQVDWQA